MPILICGQESSVASNAMRPTRVGRIMAKVQDHQGTEALEWGHPNLEDGTAIEIENGGLDNLIECLESHCSRAAILCHLLRVQELWEWARNNLAPTS